VRGDNLWKRILKIAVLLAGVSLAAGIWAKDRGAEWQTMIFVTLGFSQLGVALALRARPRTLSNTFLIAAVVAAALLQLAGVCVPFLAAVLGTELLPATDPWPWPQACRVAGYLGIHLDRRASAVRPAAPSLCLSHWVSGSVLG
jgi:P-type Ca2+ transporter type 2C